MKSLTLIFTASLVLSVLASPHAHHPRSHQDIALARRAPAPLVVDLDLRAPKPNKKLNRRQSCKRPTSSAIPPIASSTSAVVPTTSAAPPPPPPAPTSSAPPAPKSSPPAPAPTSSAAAPGPVAPTSGHPFTLTNKCSYAVQPAVTDTKCGYSPRCDGAASYSGPNPELLQPGQSQTITINNDWVGRIYAKTPTCGPSGENCSMLEFNLDTGNQYTPQAYDISNIQGFTQSLSVGAAGCDTATCTSPSCSCEDAYPIGDESGCGADLPVKACGAGPIAFDVVFCP